MPRKRTSIKKIEAPNKFEWLKKNIVIVPVIAAIIAGTFTSVRYVLTLQILLQLTKKPLLN